MKEAQLRKIHRSVGIVLALFIILQAGTGFLFALGSFFPSAFASEVKSHSNNVQISQGEDDENSDHHMDGDEHIDGDEHVDGDTSKGEEHEHEHEQDILHFIHMGGGAPGALYRIILTLGIIFMAISGSVIFFKIQARS